MSDDSNSNSDSDSDSDSDSQLNLGKTNVKMTKIEYKKLLKSLSKHNIHNLQHSESSDENDEDYLTESESESESEYDDETESYDSEYDEEDEEEDSEYDEEEEDASKYKNKSSAKLSIVNPSQIKPSRVKQSCARPSQIKPYRVKQSCARPSCASQPNIFNIFVSGDNDYSDDEEEKNPKNNEENEDDPLSSDAEPTSKQIKKIQRQTNSDVKLIEKYLNMELSDLHMSTLTSTEKTFWEQLDNIKQANISTPEVEVSLLSICAAECKSKYYDEIIKRSAILKREKERNQRIYRQMSSADKNSAHDETAYFESLSADEQKILIKKMREINNVSNASTPYKIQILNNDNISNHIKSMAMDKIDCFQKTNSEDSEYSKMKYWIDTFMKIPFGIYHQQPISIDDGSDKCHEFMTSALETLNSVTYGLDDAKMQILQYLGQLVSNPNAIGSSIAIQGPMGTGKTTLVREGISKILNRPFAFIALGGATDSSFLEGHSYTYVGSVIGKIVQIIIESKCMNPVIYFDELDKISDSPRGEEITGILTHLTDTTQNSQFHDKYFSEIDFDLSKCLFIFSYNDESKINPILRDRMYHIRTQGYDQPEKTIISRLHLLPNICKQVRMETTDVVISDEIIRYIIDHYCVKQFNADEFGVRNLKRYLEIIYSKINLYRLVKPGTTMCGATNVSFEVSFPFNVTKSIVDGLIKNLKKDVRSEAVLSMYM